jgi:DNA-binding GntR family transcriptional regulator
VVLEHLGSAHDEVELALLMRVGWEKIHAGQEVLDLGLDRDPESATVQSMCSRQLIEALRVSPGASLFRITRVRTADDVPMALEETCFVADRLPGLLDEPLDRPLYGLIHD